MHTIFSMYSYVLFEYSAPGPGARLIIPGPVCGGNINTLSCQQEPAGVTHRSQASLGTSSNRERLHALIEHPGVQAFIIVLILLNARQNLRQVRYARILRVLLVGGRQS